MATKSKSTSSVSSTVTGSDAEGWTYECDRTDGSCGPGANGKGFTSSGWATKAQAEARGVQHAADHQGEPMQDLSEFRAEN